MKLRSLALNQFKKFTVPMRLDGIADGLNVVVGPNEMGKSTLLDALRAVLFEKHGSKAKPIEALQNDRNQAGPVVELAFELPDGLYRITKRFLRRPYARLACPDGRVLEGDAAEDALRDLLGFGEPGKTGAKPETLGMWNVLWVQQGQSFGAPEIPETARSNLRTALESEVGTVLGGRRGRMLPQVIEHELALLVTSTGRPHGPYKLLLDHLETLRSKLRDLEARRRELSETLDALEGAEYTLAQLSSGVRDQVDRAEIEGVRVRRNQRAELETRIKAALSDHTVKEHRLQSAEQAWHARRALREEIAAAESNTGAAHARLAQVTGEEKALRTRLETLRAHARALEFAVTEADNAVSLNRRILGAVEREDRIRVLSAQFETAEGAEKRQHEAEQSAAAILVTDDAIKRIRAVAKALETTNARLSAAATTITFALDPHAHGGIEIDGRPLAPERPVIQVVEETTIAIPDRGKIFVAPAIKDCDQLLAARRDRGVALKAVLDAVGASSAEDAEQQHAVRKDRLEQAALAGQEAALFAPATEDHGAGARPLAVHLAGLRQILAREKSELGTTELPAAENAEIAHRAGEQHAAAARGALGEARAGISGPEQALDRATTELGAVTARAEDAAKHLERLHSQCAESEQTISDACLKDDIDHARAALAEQARIVQGLEERRSDETLPGLDERISRLEGAIRLRQEKQATLRENIAALKSRLEVAEGTGLDEAIAQARREVELQEREQGYLAREEQVLRLLLSTLRVAESDAKERYLSPVLRRVRPYLHSLFPGADIMIDEDLQITGIVREPGHEETFHRLSMGTQEQIAVLARLAFAEMLVEQGRPATIILDDALVFSDDRRINRMFDVLSTAGRKIQIIILTCR
ncbi:MAG: AAA family ATPase, partial [Acetobacteraceae bacterium]